ARGTVPIRENTRTGCVKSPSRSSENPVVSDHKIQTSRTYVPSKLIQIEVSGCRDKRDPRSSPCLLTVVHHVMHRAYIDYDFVHTRIKNQGAVVVMLRKIPDLTGQSWTKPSTLIPICVFKAAMASIVNSRPYCMFACHPAARFQVRDSKDVGAARYSEPIS